MKRIPPTILLACTLATSLVHGVVSTANAQSDDQRFRGWAGESVLDDPEWRARFLGSYGFLSGAEPQIRPDELEMLREVIDLMRANPRAAETMLGSQVTPDSSAALDFILANLQFQNGHNAEAALSYDRALKKFPDFRRAHKNAGLLLVQSEDYKGGLEHLTRAVELGESDGRTYGLIGYCNLNLEHYLAAEQAYRQAVLMQPEMRDWQLGLARSLLAMDKFEEAAAIFGAVIDADPSNDTAWVGQANAYLGLGNPRAAAVDLEAVRAMGKAKTSTLVLLGDIYMNEGMTDLARSAYVEVIESDAQGAQFETAYRAAELLVRAGSYDQARLVVSSIDKRYGGSLDMDDELSVLTLRAKLARGQGRDKEAVTILESIVERDGTRGDALTELAEYHDDRGDSVRALLYIERAQNIEGYEYDALLKHAQYRVAAGDYREGAVLLRKALAIRREPRVESYLARVEQQAGR